MDDRLSTFNALGWELLNIQEETCQEDDCYRYSEGFCCYGIAGFSVEILIYWSFELLPMASVNVSSGEFYKRSIRLSNIEVANLPFSVNEQDLSDWLKEVREWLPYHEDVLEYFSDTIL